MIFTLITLLLIICDQVSKIAVLKYLKPVGTTVVLKDILSLTYVENRGAAFGILQNSRWVFICATIIILAVLIIYKIKYKPQGKIINTSLCLLISGAIGNLIDRIFRGFVVDMLEVTFIEYPVFNVADCFVVVGAILLGIYIMFIYKEPEKEMKKND
jgi:signal peptidase II